MDTSVIVGLGQLGGVFAHGLLRTGHRIVPIRRSESVDSIQDEDPSLVLIAVGEGDLQNVLPQVPEAWRSRVGLIQNELLPGSWSALGDVNPTVAVVWFEKKAPIAPHVIRPTPIAGPNALRLVNALASLNIAAEEIDESALPAALVLKNVYILTANVGGRGAPKGATTGELWTDDRERTQRLAEDVLTLQKAMLCASGHSKAAAALDDDALMRELGETLMADPHHGACGRSAPARHQRALTLAHTHGLTLPALAEARVLED
ncbi:MAG: hypothetical protein ACI9KE_006260 [Polyangiales bacterium]|jgi:hypothetical protein